uniref:Uncharacterized protein n=1 Tax=Peromyscus maniculatus bairdii TaxID=230844 RepID=A0A8C8UM17_PERMB
DPVHLHPKVSAPGHSQHLPFMKLSATILLIHGSLEVLVAAQTCWLGFTPPFPSVVLEPLERSLPQGQQCWGDDAGCAGQRGGSQGFASSQSMALGKLCPISGASFLSCKHSFFNPKDFTYKN